MPYFVYRIGSGPVRTLTKLDAFPAFREASQFAKACRADQSGQIKVIFAENELNAEDLLSTVREAKMTGDDD